MPQTINNMVATWNNAATTFTFLKANITDTASSASSLLMDLQVGGVSQFKVSKTGQVQLAAGSVSLPSLSFEASSGFYRPSASSLALTISGGAQWAQFGNLFRATSTMAFGWASGEPIGNNIDTILTRRGTANLRLGAADAAAPVAQTLSVQSVVAGTTNTAGANLTITGSQGTGTGAGGSIIFQVAPAGSSGTAQNALATALTINSSGTVSIGGLTIDPSNGGITFLQTFGITMQTSNAFVIRHGNNDGLDVRPVSSGSPNILLKNASNVIQAALWGEATNTLALRNGANAQTFRVYNTTDGTNSEWLGIGASSNIFRISANATGTGTARSIQFTTNGGSIDFGTGNESSITAVWRIAMGSGGHLICPTDNTYDIGASGANRPRNVYVAGDVNAAGAVVAAASQKFQISGRLNYSSPAVGVAEIRTPAQAAGTVYLGQNTVANLPSASSYAGSLAFVSDATATTARSTVAGGGSNKVMVMSDGANWLIVA